MYSEKKLVELCLKKDSKAMDELYIRYSPRMYGVCLRYVKKKEDAQDVLHDGFMKVFASLNSFRGEGSLEGWILRIMTFQAINFYKRHMLRYNFTDNQAYVEDCDGVPDVISEMSEKEILELIQELPDGYRLVFNLYVIEGYKHDEIAEMLSISPNTSKTQLMKARRCLIEQIKKRAYENA